MGALLFGILVLAWHEHGRALTAIGGALTVEDPLAPVEVIVASLASARADTLEAAKLYRDGIAKRVVVAQWQHEALDDEMRRLGVPYLPVTELAVAMLEKSGVPANAITVLHEPIDGLNTEIASVAAFARAERPRSLLFVTARNHTRRARWLLERSLPAGTALAVRAPALDEFDPQGGWHSRDGSREVAMEYLRWMNTFGLRDLWGANAAPPPAVAEPAG
jgi:uncharacterized SAM-binding protein YcdF (DUF218 family)